MDQSNNSTDASFPKPIIDTTEPEKALPVSSLIGKIIMWVEDDKFISNIIRRKLEKEGATLVTASHGEEAVEIIKKTAVDLIILDIILPGMNGIQILQFIRRNPATSKTPVIMLTNLNQKDDRDMCAVLGVSDFFLKASISLDEVVKRIKEILCQK